MSNYDMFYMILDGAYVAVSIAWVLLTYRVVSYCIKACKNSGGFVTQVRRREISGRYEYLNHVLNEAKEIAYQKIWQEDIAKHPTSGFKLNGDDIVAMRRKFVKHVFTFCGPAIQADLNILHGDLDSIVLSLITWFDTKANIDEATVLSSVYENGDSGKNA